MSFADFYFERYKSVPRVIDCEPSGDLYTIITIPCFNEPDLLSSLSALKNCTKPKFDIEVIICINSSENSDKKEIDQNDNTIRIAENWIAENNTEFLKFHLLHFPNLLHKTAGVGMARKIAMDEALRRFNLLNKPEGIIVGFDADSLCDENYLQEIENHFVKYPKSPGASIYFEHPVLGNDFDISIYGRITEYELYLRYYVEALRYCKFPYAFHTIGSSFAVRAKAYAMQGGMNTKKAGEDFYFLQKIIPLGNFTEINSTRVIPSPRPSNRVPFGTGAAISKLINSETIYETYNFNAFADLKLFFDNKNNLFQTDTINYLIFPQSVAQFLIENNFETDLLKINKNSPNLKIFEKRFYDWFDAFRVLKFLNFVHPLYYNKVPVNEACSQLHEALSGKPIKEMLLHFRSVQKLQ